MKRLLLLTLLFCAAIGGRAQVILNEVYTEPGNNNDEFFELYNTSYSPVSLDCYYLVVLYATSSTKGFYVIDLPANAQIPSRGYYTGSSRNTISYQGSSSVSSFNWNIPSGSITRYQIQNGSYVVTTMNTATTPIFDLFSKMKPNDFGSLVDGVFLFNSGTYLGGLMTGIGSNVVPSEIRTILPATNISINCNGAPPVSYSLNWSTITNADNVGSASGSDNGYARTGSCGSTQLWVKTSSQINHTPNTGNIFTGTNTNLINASQENICGKQINVSISNLVSSPVYPVEVLLYLDNPNTNVWSTNDQLISTLIITGPETQSFSNLAGGNYLLVYKTASGCTDKVIFPQIPTTSLTMQATSYCNRIVEYSITGANVAAANYAFPLLVEVHNDLNNNGVYDVATESPIVSVQEVNSVSANTLTFSGLTGTFSPLLIVKSKNNTCFTFPVIVPQPASGSLQSSATVFCNKRVEFTITQALGAAATYAFPVTVEAHYDLNNNGIYDPATEGAIAVSQVVNSASSTVYPLTGLNGVNNVLLVYQSAFGCYMPTALQPTAITGTLSTTESIVCGTATEKTLVSYQFTGTSSGIEAVSVPMKVSLFYDLDASGTVTTGDGPSKQDVSISGLMPNGANFELPIDDRKQSVLIRYEPEIGCYAKDVFIGNECKVLPVKFSYFTARRNAENKKQVQLEWETTMEQNNKGFYIQRMTKGEWEDIGFVNTAAADGNSNVALKYRFADVNLFGGTTYYRMYQVDFDGKADYSEVKSVDGQGLGKTQLVVYPNPAPGGSTTVVFATDANRTILLVDATGRVVQQWRNHAGNRLTLRQLQPGLYTLKVSEGNNAAPLMEKIIVQ